MTVKRHPIGDHQIESYYFTRLVPDRGYIWLEEAEAPGQSFHFKLSGKAPFLMVNPDSKFARQYEPLRDHPLLYREFSSLPFEKAAIQQFANTYGWLGIPELVTRPMPRWGKGVSTPVLQAEGVNLWYAEIQELDFLVQVWDLIVAGKVTELSRLLRWDLQHEAVYLEAGIANKRLLDAAHPFVKGRIQVEMPPEDSPGISYFAVIADSSFNSPHLYKAWPVGEPVIPLTFYIGQQVNARLQKHVSPRILLGRNNEAVGKIVPHNLLGALWFQFYQAITGLEKVINCVVCNKGLDVSESRSTKRMHDRCARREQMRRYHESKKARRIDG